MARSRFTDGRGTERGVWEVGVRAIATASVERVRDVSDLPERWLSFASGADRRRDGVLPA
jgi:hypothetical protein